MRIITTLFLLLLSLQACKAQRVGSKAYDWMLKALLKEDVPTLSVAQVDSLQKANPDVVLLDTREKSEYDVSHIAGAIWVGYDDFEVSRLKGIDKDATIVAYCSVGARSENVTRQLLQAGYTDVENLYGSIFEWVNQGHTVVDSTGTATLRVHAYNRKWGIWLKKGESVYE